MDSIWELPTLRGTLRPGGQTESEVNPIIFYDVEFYPYTPPGLDPVFAVCGGLYTIICRCILDKSNAIEILRWFEDEETTAGDGTANNGYNSVVWSQAENGDPLVCVTGDSRIKVLNVRTGKLVATLIGHGDNVLDLAISPVDPTILASVGTDCSLRMWSLRPSHQKQPLGAICFGEAHKDQILTLAYHRKGRYILTAGMDLGVILWTVPDDVQEHAGTDKPLTVRYPHFFTTELHTDFVDCLQWYNDLFFSHACRENKIVLSSIDGFNSDRATPPAPIPTSKAVRSRTPVSITANSTTSTRSAWGGRFQRLLQFEMPHTNQFYIRFSVFHEMGYPPIVVAGNEKSKSFFWDLHRLEMSGDGDGESPGQKGVPLGLPRHVREGSSVSTASSMISARSGNTNRRRKKVKEQILDRGIGDPFHSIRAHKVIEIPKYQAFAFRQFAWSRDGQWCVGVGDCGTICVFNRWEKGLPPMSLDKPVLKQEQKPDFS
ncbi:WD40 repeat-like protein [Decorospora gaudefroyi]|uniref:WD40 repeat-like protein n=1 Tax=Decorospora gaudefroyi TaxID=184978 RepID=A0A6A5KCN8_9PLEO|nr:WD40 repeat-like protein [Decorospora gaudefroyi]